MSCLRLKTRFPQNFTGKRVFLNLQKHLPRFNSRPGLIQQFHIFAGIL